MSQRMDRKNYKIKKITRVKEKQKTQNANSLIMLQLQNNHLTHVMACLT